MVHSATVRPTETRHCTCATVYLQWDERRALIAVVDGKYQGMQHFRLLIWIKNVPIIEPSVEEISKFIL